MIDDIDLNDGELVIYQADSEYADSESVIAQEEEHGIIAMSLWLRYSDEGFEIPLYTHSKTGQWVSYSVEEYRPAPGEPVSDEFIECIGGLQYERYGDGWGTVEREDFEELRLLERIMVNTIQFELIHGRATTALMVIDWCENHSENLGEDE